MCEDEILFWAQQRDALLMQVRAIEKRLGIQSVARCPQCQCRFVLGAKHQKQMGPAGCSHSHDLER